MSQTPATFATGETARYLGDPRGRDYDVIAPGDKVTIYQGNLADPEGDVWVIHGEGTPKPVSASELEPA